MKVKVRKSWGELNPRTKVQPSEKDKKRAKRLDAGKMKRYIDDEINE